MPRKRIAGRRKHHSRAHKTNGGSNKLMIDSVGRDKTPLLKKGKTLDRLQTGLSIAGTIFPQADALNALVSGGRAGYAALTGDKEGASLHGKAAALNAAAIIPGVGETIKATKAGKILKTMPSKQLTDASKSLKNLKNIKSSTTKAKDVMNIVSTGGNVGYWGGTAKQLSGEVKDKYDDIKGSKNKKLNVSTTYNNNKNIT
jgi:hypothetical protein